MQQSSTCDALKGNGHPCHGYGQGVGPEPFKGHLCHMHTAFFDSEERLYDFVWTRASLFQSEQERQWIIRMLQTPSCRHIAHKLTDYSTKCLMMAADDNGLSPYTRGKLEYVYEIFVHAGTLPPLNVKPLWKRVVSKQLRVLQYCVATGSEYDPILMKFLVPFFKDATPGKALPYLITLMKTEQFNMRNGGSFISHSIRLWFIVFSAIFKVMNMRPVIASPVEDIVTQAIQVHRRKYPASMLLHEQVSGALIDILNFHKKEEMQKIRARTAVFKEELVAKVWSPARVLRLLECGLEPEDF